MIFALCFVFPAAKALGQFTTITVTTTNSCVTVGETIAVTAVLVPPTNNTKPMTMTSVLETPRPS